METIKSDNELIAQFVGYNSCKTEHDTFWNYPSERCTTDNWRFHSNGLAFNVMWDWFMPAFAKFGGLDFDSTPDRNRHSDLCASIAEKVLEVDILGAHERLVEGIKWYNQKSLTS